MVLLQAPPPEALRKAWGSNSELCFSALQKRQQEFLSDDFRSWGLGSGLSDESFRTKANGVGIYPKP